MGITIKWDITYKCNLNCQHCINGEYLNKSNEEINFNEIKHVISSIKEVDEINYIHFLGGEPTVRRDFLEICKYLNDSAIRFGFNSNCLKLKGEFLKSLLELEYLECITISMESSNKEINDFIRGKKVYSEIIKTINEINKFEGDKPKICINTVLSKLNFKEVGEMIQFCEDNNIHELSLLELIEFGNAKNSNLSLNYDEKWEVLQIINNKLREDNYKLIIKPKFVRQLTIDAFNFIESGRIPSTGHTCGAGIDFIFIDNNGFCFSCDGIRTMKMQSEQLNLVEKDFRKVWENENFSKVFSRLESQKYNSLIPCCDCKYFKNECIPCPIELEKIGSEECLKSLDKINKYKYGKLEIKNRPIRFAEEDDRYFIYHVKTGTTLQLDNVSYKMLKYIYYRNVTSIDDLGKDENFKNIPIREVTGFLDFLKEEKIISWGMYV